MIIIMHYKTFTSDNKKIHTMYYDLHHIINKKRVKHILPKKKKKIAQLIAKISSNHFATELPPLDLLKAI